MRGDMGGYFEARAQGPKREQFRLFCILENAAPDELQKRGLPGPAIAVMMGLRKPWMTTFNGPRLRRSPGVGRRLPRQHATAYSHVTRLDPERETVHPVSCLAAE